MTRDRFICTDCSATAPGEVLARHERRQDRAQTRAHRARSRCRSRTRAPRARPADGSSISTSAASPSESTICASCDGDEQPAPVDDVGEQPADRREEQQRAELREEDEADERRRAGQLERVRAEHDVLHPRADVRRERAEVDDAEVAVPQRGLRGAPLVRDVAVDSASSTSSELGGSSRAAPSRTPYDGSGTGHVPITCSARRRASSSSVTPSSSRSTSSVCWPSVGAGPVQ